MLSVTLALLGITCSRLPCRTGVDFRATLQPQVTLTIDERDGLSFAEVTRFHEEHPLPVTARVGSMVAEVGPRGVLLGGVLAGGP